MIPRVRGSTCKIGFDVGGAVFEAERWFRSNGGKASSLNDVAHRQDRENWKCYH